jgi:hypothetical protein
VIEIRSIVEGYGEVEAVPILLRRLAESILPDMPFSAPRPIRVSRPKLIQQTHELQRVIELAALQLQPPGGILLLLDSDGEPPCVLGPTLVEKVREIRPDLAKYVVIAHREYEAWFLAAARSLRGQRGLRPDLEPPPQPEAVHDAKGWLTRNMQQGRRYREPLDQPALSAKFDLAAARAAKSFDKLYREVETLLRRARI